MENFIFDLYGTLADIRTDEQNPKFRKIIARRFYKKFAVADFWSDYERLCEEACKGRFCEIDLFEVFKRLTGGASDERVQKECDFFRKKSRSRLRLYRGASKLLFNLKKRGAGVYLLSNAQRCFTVGELKKLKILSMFDGVILSSEEGKKKPCAEIFEAAVNRFGISAGGAVYVGNDFSADVLGAKSVGLNTAYISSNLSPRGDDLKKISGVADFVCSDFGALSRYLIKIAEKRGGAGQSFN